MIFDLSGSHYELIEATDLNMSYAMNLIDPAWWLGVAVGSLLDPVLVVVAFMVSLNPKSPVKSRWLFSLIYPSLMLTYKALDRALVSADYFAVMPGILACWTLAFVIFSVSQMLKRKKATGPVSSTEQGG